MREWDQRASRHPCAPFQAFQDIPREPVTELGTIAPNILKRNFKAAMPNEKWATDVTEFNVSGNKLYLSPIIDLFNGEIISYALSERPHFNQTVNMLKKSFEKIQIKVI